MAKKTGSGNGKGQALEEAIVRIEKSFGKGALMRLGEAGSRMAVEVIPSGSLSLDLALGVGGIPRGRITEIFGPEASGKSTLAQHIVAQAQAGGGTAVYVDVEHALDPTYAARCGVRVDELMVSQPDSGEQALEIVEAVVRSGAVDAVIIDSVAALVPKAEIEGQMGDVHMGLQARLMSQALRKLCAATSNNRTAVVFINQLRDKIGVVFGRPEVTPGGRALKFYASVRVDLRIVGVIKQGSNTMGYNIKAKVVKNKMAAPFREATFDIMFGQGISREGEIIDRGVELGVLTSRGTWYQWNGQMLGQGREAVKSFLGQHPDTTREIEKSILARLQTTVFRTPLPAGQPAQEEQAGPGDNHQRHAGHEDTAHLFDLQAS